MLLTSASHPAASHLLAPVSTSAWDLEFARNGLLMTVTVITSSRPPEDTSSPPSPTQTHPPHPPCLALSRAGPCSVPLPGFGMNKLKRHFSHSFAGMISELR